MVGHACGRVVFYVVLALVSILMSVHTRGEVGDARDWLLFLSLAVLGLGVEYPPPSITSAIDLDRD